VLARCLDVAADLAVSPVRRGMRPPTLPAGQGPVLVLDGCIVALILVGLVVDDREDLDEAEGGSQPPQGRRLVGIDLGMARVGYRRGGWSRRAPRCR